MIIIRCKYFTGKFEGRCGQGVEYESVKDQNRAGELPRYPCQPEMDSFTSCLNFELDKELKRLSGYIGREVRLSDSGYSSKVKYRLATLLAIENSGRHAFVLVGKKKEIVGLHVIHLTRKKA